jgi:uncharacterized protein (TIGR03663 family)
MDQIATSTSNASEVNLAANNSKRALAWLDKPVLATLDWEKILYIAFFLIAVVSRFWDLGARVMSHDESLHTYFSYNLATGKGFAHTPLMHGPLLFHITALMYFLFGDSDFTSRIAPAVFGIVLVILPFFFRRWLGRKGALVTSLMLLISPSILYHARYIRQEEFILVWTLLTALCTWRYLTTRRSGWLMGLSVVLALHASDKSTSFLTAAMFLAFLAPLALIQVYAARRRRADVLSAVILVTYLGVVMLAGSILFTLVSRFLSSSLNLSNIVSQLNPLTLNFDYRTVLYAGAVVILGALFGLLVYSTTQRFFGSWLRLAFSAAPAFNILIVIVTTTMLMASPALLLVLNPIWRIASGADLIKIELLGDMSNLATNMPVITTMFGLSVMLIALSIVIGIVWRWRLWLPIAGIFATITATLFTTVFTNAAGFGTGFVGQLGYWMAQQNVKRGSQPPYYYFLIVPLYEYTLIIGSLCAIIYIAYRIGILLASSSAANSATIDYSSGEPAVEPAPPRNLLDYPLAQALVNPDKLFPIFLVWWTLATWVIYSIAGEKMPWLTVHFALPMALLTGWFLEYVMSPSPAHSSLTLRKGLALSGLALFVVLMVVRVGSLIAGLNLQPGDSIGLLRWVASLVFTCAVIAGVLYLSRRTAPGYMGRALILASFAFLSILTIRTAFMVTYINYDYVKEFLFYAHGAPGTKLAVSQLEDLSKRISGDMSLKVGYDSDVSWPMTWYMREFPNARFFGESLPNDYADLDAIMIGDVNPKKSDNEAKLQDNYTKFSYMLVWWPMQDYFDLNWERISYSLTNPQARAALLDIIFNRDFTKYSQVFNKNTLTADSWSPGHRFTLYIRNDVVSKVWTYQAGTIPQSASTITQTVKLIGPTGIAFASNGQRLVIDHKANRVARINADGNIVSTFGAFGSETGKFNDAWGIAVDSDGSIYVADTFNHRIQKFDPQGNFLFSWGTPGVSTAPGAARVTTFFGPRAIAIDKQGRLFVTDTGNKRVQVFDREGNYISQFGKSGTGNGEFNEPVGIAVDQAGNIYVADTWNQRIQVFDPSFKFLRMWTVVAWQQMDQNDLQSVDHKPFLAVSGNTLYVSSPKTQQVFAFTLDGKPVSLPGVSFSSDSLPTGLAIYNNTLYVTNASGGPVLQFSLPPGLIRTPFGGDQDKGYYAK